MARHVALTVALLCAMGLPGTPARAQVAPPVRLYAATDPGSDAFAAALGRGAGLQSLGLPPWSNGVVTTENDDDDVWLTGIYRTTKLRPEAGGATGPLRADTGGFALGLDRRLSDTVLAGVSVARTVSGLHGPAGRGTAATTSASVYGSVAWPNVLYVSGVVQWDGTEVSRRSGSFNGVHAGGAVGHLIDLPGFTFTPLAEIEYASGDDAPGTERLTARAGVRATSAFFRWGVLGAPHVGLFWERRLEAASAAPGLTQTGTDGVADFGLTMSLPGGFYTGADVTQHFGGRLGETAVRASIAKGI